jgi:hypothetical protein
VVSRVMQPRFYCTKFNPKVGINFPIFFVLA